MTVHIGARLLIGYKLVLVKCIRICMQYIPLAMGPQAQSMWSLLTQWTNLYEGLIEPKRTLNRPNRMSEYLLLLKHQLSFVYSAYVRTYTETVAARYSDLC